MNCPNRVVSCAYGIRVIYSFLSSASETACYNSFPLSPLCPANSNGPPFGCSDLLSTNRFSSDCGCLETFSSSLYIVVHSLNAFMVRFGMI